MLDKPRLVHGVLTQYLRTASSEGLCMEALATFRASMPTRPIAGIRLTYLPPGFPST